MLQVLETSGRLGLSATVTFAGFYTSSGPDYSTLPSTAEADGSFRVVETIHRASKLKAGVFMYGTGGASTGFLSSATIVNGVLRVLKLSAAPYIESLKDAFAEDRAWLASIGVEKEAIQLLVDKERLRKVDLLEMQDDDIRTLLGALPAANRVRLVSALSKERAQLPMGEGGAGV